MDNRSVHLPGEHPAARGEDSRPQGRRSGRRRPISFYCITLRASCKSGWWGVYSGIW